MDDNLGVSAGENKKLSAELMNVYLVVFIGFSCLIGWELSALFSPSLTLLSFCGLQAGIVLRVFSVFALAAGFVLFYLRGDWVFEHRNRLFTAGALSALLAVANTAANLVVGGIPFFVSAAAWLLFGFAQACVMMYWCVLLSLIPTRFTGVVVCVACIFGTFLFVFANTSASPWFGLTQIAFLIVASVGLAAFMSMRLAPDKVLPVSEYRKSRVMSVSASFSVAASGLVYGFVSLVICTLGALPALITASCGIFGAVLSLVWAVRGRRVEVSVGMVQRISLPATVAGLLFLPFMLDVSVWGAVLCGGLVNASLAHASTTAWWSTGVENAEFQLHPVDRFAMRQAMSWVGFLVGTLLTYVLVFSFGLLENGALLALTTAVVSFLTVTAFAVYGADDTEARNRLNDLLGEAADAARDVVGEPVTEEPDEDSPAALARRCDAVVEEYGLTKREAEVLYLLAKGRNAEYISNQLVVSAATVKSHIYHIYRKLGINSQQRLMTIVDESAGGAAVEAD